MPKLPFGNIHEPDLARQKTKANSDLDYSICHNYWQSDSRKRILAPLMLHLASVSCLLCIHPDGVQQRFLLGSNAIYDETGQYQFLDPFNSLG